MALAPALYYYVDMVGLPIKHVAMLTKSPTGTVMSRLHRARRRLRTHLQARTNTASALQDTETDLCVPA